MKKNAKTTHPIHDLLERRWSPRGFSERTVEPATLGSLFEAARWSASCYNEQPWRFIVASRTDIDSHRRLAGCLVEANREWAENAGALVLCAVKNTFTHNGNPNRYVWHDLGAATAQLTLQAMALGLHVHPMAGILADKAREEYAIPPEFEPVTILAIGHLGDPGILPDALKEQEVAPRERRPLTELVFTDRWELPARFS
uniref:Nitroreductase n=1 Tax=Candidatus Kentrum sp. DK TaxID=2126562 RepID=A0A450RYY3_9GAMM|nr:MAG: Nitroreductase [Candidatus Kentron sp. DK]